MLAPDASTAKVKAVRLLAAGLLAGVALLAGPLSASGPERGGAGGEPGVAGEANGDAPGARSPEAREERRTEASGGPGAAGKAANQPDAAAASAANGAEPGTEGGSGEAEAAAAFLETGRLDRPRTYRLRVTVHGWRDRATRTVDMTIVDAEYVGEVDASTGEPLGDPARDEADMSDMLRGIRVLAGATPAAAERVAAGARTVQAVLFPSGDGAVLIVDRVL